MIPVIPITQFSTIPSDNLLPFFYTYDVIYSMATTGSGTANQEQGEHMYGDRCLQLYSPSTAAAFTANPNGTDGNLTISEDGHYFLCFGLKDKLGVLLSSEDIFSLKVYKNGVAYDTATISKSLMPITDKVYFFYIELDLIASDVLSFGNILPQKSGGGITATENQVDVDFMKLEIDNKGMTLPSAYSYPTSYLNTLPSINGYYQVKNTGNYWEWSLLLSSVETLDFPSTLNGASSDLTFTLTGAVDGMNFSVNAPAAAQIAGNTFIAFCSSANTVTVRYTNNTGSTQNLVSADYTIKQF